MPNDQTLDTAGAEPEEKFTQADIDKAVVEAMKEFADYDTWKTKAIKSKEDLKQAAERNQYLSDQIAASSVDVQRYKLALEYGLPACDIDLLQGDEKQMEALAERLAAGQQTNPIDVKQGRFNSAKNTNPLTDYVLAMFSAPSK